MPQPSSRSPKAKHKARRRQLASRFSVPFSTFSHESRLILGLIRDFHFGFGPTDNVHPSASPLQRSDPFGRLVAFTRLVDSDLQERPEIGKPDSGWAVAKPGVTPRIGSPGITSA